MNWHNELGQIAREQASPSLHIADTEEATIKRARSLSAKQARLYL